ncbi:putative ABC transport system permease protein [Catalinimonas alkaloidigena]|uniref:Putative ABC transport system permease protein n=1 Tax=Catalinimonas alkaloidigena TaxID=1075417 RepID=A0A1G8XQV9_9BACT|nr:ABC transporter permease [Catalinimonas alkaloidigena]SDJ92857.1 putative ABC transport system permease protein [Catalinimonas alkaloidigena]
MFYNYWQIILRQCLKHRAYTLINVVGLTAGLVTCLLAFLYAHHEYSYDRFHQHHERTYRIISHYRSQWYPVLGFPGYADADAAQQQEKLDYLRALPDIEKVAQFAVTGDQENFITTREKTFAQKHILFTNTGPAFLDLFTWTFLEGDPTSAFAQPNSAILTETAARRHFGETYAEAALGHTIRLDSIDYRITGIIADVPDVSHVGFEMALNPARIPAWGAYTYVRSRPEVTPARLATEITAALHRQNPARVDDPLVKGEQVQRLADIHLRSNVLYELKPPGDVRYFYLFAWMGAVILLITLISYVNLSVAVYHGRHKEVGLRKVLGARPWELRVQFLCEALFFALLSWLLALGVIDALLPAFNRLMNLELINLYVRDWRFVLAPLALVVLIAGLAGLYPALLLAGQHIVGLFRPKQHPKRNARLRRVLVISQFTLIISLLGVTYIINDQLRYVQRKNLGFVREGIVQIPLEDVDVYQRLKQRLVQEPDIHQVGSGLLPGSATFNHIDYVPEGFQVVMDDAHTLYMDVAYWQVLGMDSAALSAALHPGAPEQLFYINETAARQFGWDAHSAVGKTIVLEPSWENGALGEGIPKTVAGVLPDIHFFSLRQKVGPLFYEVAQEPRWVEQMVVRFDATQTSQVLSLLEREYQALVKEAPFSYEFLTERLDQLYAQERDISRLTLVISGIAMALALLGLLGLVAYLAQTRTKEIGVRKVLGASIGQVLLLLNREFIVGVAVATLLAAPVAYLLAQQWLLDFAYRVDIKVSILLVIGLSISLLTSLVVSLRSLLVATANPVEALRDE